MKEGKEHKMSKHSHFLWSLYFFVKVRKKSSIDQMKTVKSESCNTKTLYYSKTGFIPKLNNA